MANFYEDDSPVASFDYDLTQEAADGATAVLSLSGQTVPAELDGDRLTGTWETLELPEAGKYPIYAVLTVGERAERELIDWLVVDDPNTGWHTNASARNEWAGAPTSDGDLYELLAIAKDQVLAYAPTLRVLEVVDGVVDGGDAFDDPPAVSVNLRRAQLMQARNILNASRADQDGTSGGEGFSTTVFPMDWSVKNLIRPKRGVPVVR